MASKVTRNQGWPGLLAAFQKASRLRPFRYGRWDCCLAACDAVEAMTGFDPAMGFRGQYEDEDGARALFDVYGGTLEGLVEAVTLEHGFPELVTEEGDPAPLYAQRGDLALVEGSQGAALGFVDAEGSRVAIATQPAGLLHVPLRMAKRAWKVG